MRDSKAFNVGFLAVAELLAMTLWFSASAVVPQLSAEFSLTNSEQSWMTMSVQIGFVIGALFSSVLNVADRIASRHLFALTAVLGAAVNAAIPYFNLSVDTIIGLRFLTGMMLAGVYPPGMKIMTTWCKKDRGLCIGILVGALTAGSAAPHLIAALTPSGPGLLLDWRVVLYTTSVLALISAVLALLVINDGPFTPKLAPFNWKYSAKSFTYLPTRLANFGYLGHMWELYAMWAWVPIMILASYEQAGWTSGSARIAGFSVIAVGALGCIIAGKLADKLGRTTITSWSLIISGGCSLIAGMLFSHPGWLTAVCILWGFAVVADSAQFSAAITELSDQRYIGTALTIQTSMGFLLTLVSIRLIPVLVDWWDWHWSLPVLVLGPVFGIYSMLKLRSLPEAGKMASGSR